MIGDVLDCVFNYGSLEEVEIVFDLYIRNYGPKFLENFLSEKEESLRAFIDRHHGKILQKFIDLYLSKGIDPTTFLNEKDFATLAKHQDVESFKLSLGEEL
jgi:hypothetical protein